MNIRQHYLKTSHIHLSVAKISLILLIIGLCTLIYFRVDKIVLLSLVPFYFISIFSFTFYRMNKNRSSLVHLPDRDQLLSLLEQDDLVLVFLPAPTLRMQFYHPIGSFLGELRDHSLAWYWWLIPNMISFWLPKKYILLDMDQKVVASFKVYAKNERMEIFNESKKLIGTYYSDKKFLWTITSGFFYNKVGNPSVKVDTMVMAQEFTLERIDAAKIGKLSIGWLPSNWSERFNCNSPIIQFSSLAKEEERIFGLAYCSLLFHHQNN